MLPRFPLFSASPLKRLLAQRGRRSPRFALAVVFALALLALPSTEIWRRHSIELEAALDARQALAPVALAVQAQRALVAHRPFAAAVLSGRAEQEPERARRQYAVDGAVAALVAGLEFQRLHRALAEADRLRDDWSALLEGIGRRAVDAGASNDAHDLLVEQTFVVVDLVGGSSGLNGQAARAIDAAELDFVLHTLPRYALALHAAAHARAAQAPPDAQAAAAAAERLRRQARATAARAGELLAAIDADSERTPDAALVHALVALRQGAQQLARGPLADSNGNAANGAAVAALAARSLAAADEAGAATLAHLDRRLVEAVAVLRLERRLVGAALVVALLLAAVAALRALPLHTRHTAQRAMPAVPQQRRVLAHADDALDTSAGQLGGENEQSASHLLRRLRRGEGEREPVQAGAEAAPGAGTAAVAPAGERRAD